MDGFELKQLANLRAHDICDLNSNQSARLAPIDIETTPSWLKKLAVDIKFKNATLRNDQFDLMNLNYQISKRALAKKKKAFYTEQALKLAKKLNHKKFIQSMEKRLARFQQNPNNLSYLNTSLNLIYKRQFNQALKNLTQISHSNKYRFYDRYRAYKGIRKLRKLQLNEKAYIKATEALAQFVQRSYNQYKKPSVSLTSRYHNTQILLARTYWTKNKVTKAINTLRITARKLKSKYSMAKVYFLRGRIDEERGKLTAAVWWYQQSLKQKKLSHFSNQPTQWFLAWNLRKLGENKKAIPAFESLIESSYDNFDKNRYKYWLAKTLQSENQTQKANQLFDELTTKDIMGYYGLLAARELGQNLKQVYSKRHLASVKQRSGSDLINENKVKWLLAVKENEVAGLYLSSLARRLRHNKEGDTHTWSQLFSYYLKSEQYLKMFADLGQLKRNLRQELITINPEIFFPRPYYDCVVKAAEKFNLSPSLVYAVIRQESAFNPNARSFAHAMGLMQLLPEVAKSTAKKYKLPLKNNSDLYNPNVNIPLGTAFLKELFARYNNQFIIAVASYNASEKAIQNWLKTRFNGDAIEFIEDIPYEETRTYVRLVMRNFIYYEIQQGASVPFTFPEWALNLKVAGN